MKSWPNIPPSRGVYCENTVARGRGGGNLVAGKKWKIKVFIKKGKMGLNVFLDYNPAPPKKISLRRACDCWGKKSRRFFFCGGWLKCIIITPASFCNNFFFRCTPLFPSPAQQNLVIRYTLSLNFVNFFSLLLNSWVHIYLRGSRKKNVILLFRINWTFLT